MVNEVIFDVNSFGITERSLKILRDTIALNADTKIAVVEVPTSMINCGFLIFIQEADGRLNIVWTGDGFRTDKGGEGGAGYNTAEVIFMLFRIIPIPLDKTWEGYDLLFSAPEEIIQEAITSKAEQILPFIPAYTVPTNTNPPYIRA